MMRQAISITLALLFGAALARAEGADWNVLKGRPDYSKGRNGPAE